MKIFFVTLIVSISLNFTLCHAQMELDWSRVYRGVYNGGADLALGIAIDDSSNIYVTGGSQISSSNFECVTIKYNKWGDTLWIKHYFRTGNFIGREIKLDDSGNVFVAAGVILKYNSNGDLIWDSYDSAGYRKIEFDSQGNIYAGGTSLGKLTTGKYNRNGQRIWRNKYSFTGSLGNDILGGFVKDISGNLIITGASRTSTTFLIMQQ
ncbi:MAG: hypothetical protein IPL53_23375 [Ignavibacteria bacterium]|nr:hypothetical protein [Ignavibacteria bacterium]